MEGMVDWRRNPIDPKKHGGVRATLFLYLLVLVRSSMNAANTNLVGFFRKTHNMTIVRAVILSTNFGGATWMLSIVGAFISDSYIRRSKAIFLFGPLEILGYGLLGFQTHLPSLHPPACNNNQDCEGLYGWKTSLVYLSIFMIALGEGFMRACTPAFGADQFDSDDPFESKKKIRFFDFAAMITCFGAILGLLLVVWVQNFKGWDLGLGVCAMFILVGLIVGAVGFPFYRNKDPAGSPLSRILQVFIAAFMKRKIHVTPENLEEPGIIDLTDSTDNVEPLQHTMDLRFLDRASIYTGETDGWSYCSFAQVEEAKIFVKLLPILVSSIFCYMPFQLFFALTAPAASTMNTRIWGLNIAPASLYAVSVFLQLNILVLYRRVILPLVTRNTSSRYSNTTFHLVRTTIGFVFAVLACATATLVERKRMMAEDPKNLSFLWMLPQFIFVGLMEVTSFVGLVEFFSNQLSTRNKSLAPSMVFCVLGLATWLDGPLIAAVSRATRSEGRRNGWLAGMEFDTTRLDLFYALLTILEVIFLLNFVFWARRYLQKN